MATIRQGYLDDYSQQNGNVGIGTSISNEKLEIIGGTTAQELDVTGISTFTHVSGFIKKHTDYTGNIDFDAGDSGTLSGEIVVGAGLTMTVGTAATASQGTVDALKVHDMFQPPSGGTNQRPPAKPGALFYNFDLKTIEFFDGNSWNQVDNTTTRGRAIFFGGYMRPDAPYSSGRNGLTIEYLQISTGGRTSSFGSYGSRRTNGSGCSNGTRALSASGFNGPGTIGSSNEIEYITIASGGDVIDFGDRTQTGYGGQAVSSSTRGVFLCNREPSNNVIDYVEIGTLGNALDFGDLNGNGGYKAGNLNSPTRGFVAGGSGPVGTNSNDIQMITIASKGNAIKTGDLSSITDNSTGASNSIRGLVSTGELGSGAIANKSIFSITLASEGNSQDFGDLTVQRGRCGGTSNQTRAIFAGGNAYGSPSYTFYKSIDSVTIASAGNATDFGSLGNPKDQFGATSDSHGGLGGF